MSRFKEFVPVGNDANGHVVYKWVTGRDKQSFFSNFAKAVQTYSPPQAAHEDAPINERVLFKDYAHQWLYAEKRGTIAETTFEHYKTRLNAHINPFFGERYIDEIQTSDVIRYFKSREDATQTSVKPEKAILNMVFQAAYEDGYTRSNPMSSRRIKVTGQEGKTREAVARENMIQALGNIGNIMDDDERNYFLMLALHAMRPEEVRGLQWKDVDPENNVIHIRKTIVYPKRNKPVISKTKTKESEADIGLVEAIKPYLIPGGPEDYITGGTEPKTCAAMRSMWKRIREQVGLPDVTESQFRTTIASDLQEETHNVMQVQQLLRHSKASTTLKHYIKPRSEITQTARTVEAIYFHPQE